MAEITLVQAVNDALREEMRRDDNVVILGEDVGVNGGVFRCTADLHKEFGDDRVIDTPLSESGIIGAAIGMALYGLKPVPEIQFSDFIWPAFDQITSELAKMRYRSGGQFTCPLVIRTPYGGGIRGGHYHSQSPEAYFAHTPGLVVVVPSAVDGRSPPEQAASSTPASRAARRGRGTRRRYRRDPVGRNPPPATSPRRIRR